MSFWKTRLLIALFAGPFWVRGSKTHEINWDCETQGFLNGSISASPFEKFKSFTPLLADNFGMPLYREVGEASDFSFKVRGDKVFLVQMAQSAYPKSPYEMEKRDIEVNPKILEDISRKFNSSCNLCNNFKYLFNCQDKITGGTICRDFMILTLSVHPMPEQKARAEISLVEHQVMLNSCNEGDYETAVQCLSLGQDQDPKIQSKSLKLSEVFHFPQVEADGFLTFWVRWKKRDTYSSNGPILEFGGGGFEDGPDLAFDFSQISLSPEENDKMSWRGKSENVGLVNLNEIFKPLYWSLETLKGVQELEYKIECLLPRFHKLSEGEVLPASEWSRTFKGLLAISVILLFKLLTLMSLLTLFLTGRLFPCI